MIGGDGDHVVVAGEVAAILVPGAAGAEDEAATMVVEHDGTLFAIDRGSPDIEVEAISAGGVR